MGKFWDWLKDRSQDDFGHKEQEKKEDEIHARWEKELREKQEKESDLEAARRNFFERAEKEFKAYSPKGPGFRIVQAPHGEYVIERRNVLSASYRPIPVFLGAERWRKMPTTPTEIYSPVKNDGRKSGSGTLFFNCFDDAEAYLTRMVSKDVPLAEYDFPPLKKRAKPAAKKKDAPQ